MMRLLMMAAFIFCASIASAAQDARIERVLAVLEKGVNVSELERVAAKDADFKNAESLYRQASNETRNPKEFARLSIEAGGAYAKASQSGVVLAALFAQFLAEDRFYPTSLYDQWSLVNGRTLSEAGYCIGYIYLATAHERAREWEGMKQSADEGLKKCRSELVAEWMIDRLNVQKSHATVMGGAKK